MISFHQPTLYTSMIWQGSKRSHCRSIGRSNERMSEQIKHEILIISLNMMIQSFRRRRLTSDIIFSDDVFLFFLGEKKANAHCDCDRLRKYSTCFEQFNCNQQQRRRRQEKWRWTMTNEFFLSTHRWIFSFVASVDVLTFFDIQSKKRISLRRYSIITRGTWSTSLLYQQKGSRCSRINDDFSLSFLIDCFEERKATMMMNVRRSIDRWDRTLVQSQNQLNLR